MRTKLLILLIGLATGAVAQHTGTQPVPKLPAQPSTNVPVPGRQGGNTIDDAVTIPALPYTTTGTTSGFTDDYDEACPYEGSTSPDVVYAISPAADVDVDIDMLGSAYDTKIYLYDNDLALVACNDDYYPDYVSRLRFVALLGGAHYFLVIDGYGGDHGDYVLSIREDELCELDCPPDAYPEGEPPLVDDYEDDYNGGCNSPQYGMPWQDLYGDVNGELIFCGVAGWYDYQGSNYRDTDWFLVHVGEAGTVTLTAEAEWSTYFMDVTYDCILHVGQRILVEECGTGSLLYEWTPGSFIPFWVGSTTFEAPGFATDNEYDYVIHFTGLMPQPVAAETASWSGVKELFR